MTATMPEPKPLEYRAEVESLESLQQQRRELMGEYAPLAAKYKGARGQGSLADSARKRHRALVMQKILVEMKQDWEAKAKPGVIAVGPFKEPSESALERMANAHTEHIEFCNKVEKEVQRYIVLENDIDEINERIESRKIELQCYNGELRLTT